MIETADEILNESTPTASETAAAAAVAATAAAEAANKAKELHLPLNQALKRQK